jgi:hypothetical protein
MSITVTHNRHEYVAGAAQTTFAYAFKILASPELLVYQDGSLVSSALYSVTGVGDQGGGNVILNTPCTGGESIVLLGQIALDQQTQYTANNAFPAAAHEAALDKLTRLTQQLDEMVRRAPAFAPSSLSRNRQVPEPESGRFLKWDGDAVHLTNDQVTSIPVGFFGGSLVGADFGVLGSGVFSITNGFTADPPDDPTRLMVLMGSASEPVTAEAPSAIIQKHSDVDSADGPQSNPALYVTNKFYGGGALRSAVAGLFVAEQRAPSIGAFVEGVRAAGVLVDPTAGNVNSAYGLIATAVASGDVPDFDFLVGVESEAINAADADVPNLMAGQFFDNTKFSASFMASGLFGKRMTAGFLCNPFSDPAVAPYAGFFAPLGSLATTGVFAESTAETVYGLRLSRGAQSFACIALPNNTPIRARESGSTSERNVLYVNTGETLVLGQESEGIILSQGDPVLGHYQKSSQSLVWSEIAAGQVANQAVTVTGVQVGDNVHATPGAPLSEFNVRAWVASTNSVAIQLHNWTVGALTPPTTDWAIDAWKHTA